MMMRHLLWKDGMAIKPLVEAILIGIVAIYLALALMLTWLGTNDSASLYVSIWVLMPNLVALGAPALLVGGEEENGTLSWLRTLPVSWQKVADAKLLVALGAVAIAWLVSSLCLFFVMASVVPNSTGYADSMLNVGGVSFLMFFSLLLLLCGFITAYLFRSPVAGLIAVVPVIAVATTLSTEVGRWILTGDIRYKGELHSLSLADYVSIVTAGFALLIAAWLLQRGLAYRRLTSPISNAINKLLEPPPVSAYRPPALVGASRPNQFVALLWQQLNQMGWSAVALTVMIAILIVNQFAESNTYAFGSNRYSVQPDGQIARFLRELAPLLIAIGASWIGGLAFYGDNLRRRCAFFADRGISPSQIWITRVLYPIIFCIMLVGVALAVGMNERYGGQGTAVLIVVMVSFGLLVGQWMQRPVMTFLAAPAYATVATVGLLIVLQTYSTYVWTATFVAPVLLFASWRLSGRWLTGRIDFGYTWRIFAYTALAVMLPVAIVLGSRYWSTPELMPQWRAAMLATRMPADAAPDYWADGNRDEISLDVFPGVGISGTFAEVSAEERFKMLRRELDSDRIGDHVSLDDVTLLLNGRTPGNDQLKQAAVAVLLKWARVIRQLVVDGKYTLNELERVAEPAEVEAVEALRSLVGRGPSPELSKLVDAIPDRKLRRESRRNGLITQWKLYDQSGWRHETHTHANGEVWYGKTFMNYPVGSIVAWIPMERTRCDRFIDKATRFTLGQLDGTLPETTDSPEFQQRVMLWREAASPPRVDNYRQDIPIGRHWTAANEKRIDALRARVASAK